MSAVNWKGGRAAEVCTDVRSSVYSGSHVEELRGGTKDELE